MSKSPLVDTRDTSEVIPSPLDLPAIWTAVIEKVRAQNASLAALLRSSSLLGLRNGEATVQVPFSFYADRLKDRKNLPVVLDVIKEITELDCTLVCTVAGVAVPAIKRSSDQAIETVRSQEEVTKDVMEVFGVEVVKAN